MKKSSMIVQNGLFLAIMYVLALLIHIPILPMVPFLLYDPSDMITVMMAKKKASNIFVGIIILLSIAQGITLDPNNWLFGTIMHIIASSSLFLISKRAKGLISIVIPSLIMGLVNVILTPYFFNMPLKIVLGLLPAIIFFNLIKNGVNYWGGVFLAKRLK